MTLMLDDLNNEYYKELHCSDYYYFTITLSYVKVSKFLIARNLSSECYNRTVGTYIHVDLRNCVVTVLVDETLSSFDKFGDVH